MITEWNKNQLSKIYANGARIYTNNKEAFATRMFDRTISVLQVQTMSEEMRQILN